MNLRTKAPLCLVVAATVISGGTGYSCYSKQGDYIEANKKTRLKEIADQLKTGFDGLNNSAKTYAELFASMPEVRKALKADDRDALVEQLEPTYKLMNARYGAEAASFYKELEAHKDPETHAPQAAGLFSILRLSNPKIRQEFDQSKRDMVVRADHTKETQAGLEVMATSAQVRAVASVDSGSEHLGCFEWGVGFPRLLNALKTRLHADFAAFIDEKAFPAALTERGRQMAADAAKAAEADRVASGYRTLEGATNTELMRQLVTSEFLASCMQVTTKEVTPEPKQPDANGASRDGAQKDGASHDANGNHDGAVANTNSNSNPNGNGNGNGKEKAAAPPPVTHEANAGDLHYGVVGIPLYDFTGRRVGVLVGVRSLEEERRVGRNTLINFVGATLVGIILLAGIFQLIFNGLLVRPANDLADNVKAIASGDINARIELTSRQDEIGALAKQVDKLRELLRQERDHAKAASVSAAGEVKP